MKNLIRETRTLRGKSLSGQAMGSNGVNRAGANGGAQVQSFDDFEMRLGDMMRGERATLGKSLLDVQRELKIKANYIAAIENCDPTAFDTPGFIAGYVRSYARYLDMDPEWVFKTFCEESGFAVAHGMSKAASVAQPEKRKARPAAVANPTDPFKRDIFAGAQTPFIPAGGAPLSRIEPRAVGSLLVLGLLLAGLGYGGYAVLQEVQKVQFAPVEQTPVVVADLDPAVSAQNTIEGDDGPQIAAAPDAAALDRLYRPQALDVPVMVARYAPISTLSPSAIGALVGGETPQGRLMAGRVDEAAETPEALPETLSPDEIIAGLMQEAVPGEVEGPVMPQVVEDANPTVTLVAVRPAWVRVNAADGTVLYEGVMQGGETFEMPQTEAPGTLRVGESGAMYFAVGGAHYGPVGATGAVTSNIVLSPENLGQTYALADITADADLAEVVNVAQVQAVE